MGAAQRRLCVGLAGGPRRRHTEQECAQNGASYAHRKDGQVGPLEIACAASTLPSRCGIPGPAAQARPCPVRPREVRAADIRCRASHKPPPAVTQRSPISELLPPRRCAGEKKPGEGSATESRTRSIDLKAAVARCTASEAFQSVRAAFTSKQSFCFTGRCSRPRHARIPDRWVCSFILPRPARLTPG